MKFSLLKSGMITEIRDIAGYGYKILSKILYLCQYAFLKSVFLLDIMQDKILHIVSFDNPFPPKYGGVIEVFYKIKALHEIGYKIYLHCFVNAVPSKSSELQDLCEKVYFYKNNYNPFYFFSKIPFSVISRNDKKILENLNKVEAPILFEGLKTAYFSGNKSLKNRLRILRLHNIEQDYFKGISKSEKNWFKKELYRFESRKYQNYEKAIQNFDHVISLSYFENDYTNQKFKNSTYIPVFHGNTKVLPLDGFGKYAIYHGDLNTSDNKKAVEYLVQIFKKRDDYKLVIASDSNEGFVKKLIGESENIEFILLRNFTHLQELLKNAHINLVISFQKSGTKLKLINSLFNSRFCIINENIIDDEEVVRFCIKVTDKEELISKIDSLIALPYIDYELRKNSLENYLSDVKNAEKIHDLISASL